MSRYALVALLVAAPAAFAEQPLPIYPGTVHTRIGNDLLIAGEYYRLAYFQTKDPLKDVARFFEKQWKDEGYLPEDYATDDVVDDKEKRTKEFLRKELWKKKPNEQEYFT